MYNVLTIEMPANIATGYVFRGFLISPRTCSQGLARTALPADMSTGETHVVRLVKAREGKHYIPSARNPPHGAHLPTNRQKRMRITIRLIRRIRKRLAPPRILTNNIRHHVSLRILEAAGRNHDGSDDDEQQDAHLYHRKDVIQQDAAPPGYRVDEARERRDGDGDASYGRPVDVGGCGAGVRRLQDPDGEADGVAGHVSEADERYSKEAGEVEDRVLLVPRLSVHVL